MVQFRHDLPDLVESFLQMVIDWLIEVVCYYSFEERLIFVGMVDAKPIIDFFILLTIGLHVGCFALIVVARDLADAFSSILRIMAWEASCRLLIIRKVLVGRLNREVLIGCLNH